MEFTEDMLEAMFGAWEKRILKSLQVNPSRAICLGCQGIHPGSPKGREFLEWFCKKHSMKFIQTSAGSGSFAPIVQP